MKLAFDKGINEDGKLKFVTVGGMDSQNLIGSMSESVPIKFPELSATSQSICRIRKKEIVLLKQRIYILISVPVTGRMRKVT